MLYTTPANAEAKSNNFQTKAVIRALPGDQGGNDYDTCKLQTDFEAERHFLSGGSKYFAKKPLAQSGGCAYIRSHITA